MKYIRYLLILMCLTLTSCASIYQSHQLHQGRSNFQHGNFKAAFNQLLPSAYHGNAEAQYAVGYMYFYGYGVPMDRASGKYWITKSARQDYLPAINALELIRQSEMQAHPLQAQTPNILMKAINSTKNAKADVKKTSLYENSLRTVAFVPQVKSNLYTLQVYGSYDLADVKKLQAKLKIEEDSFYSKTQFHHHDWYVLTYGKYVNVHQAKLAENEMPASVKKFNPWVRKMSDLDVV